MLGDQRPSLVQTETTSFVFDVGGGPNKVGVKAPSDKFFFSCSSCAQQHITHSTDGQPS